MELTLNKSIELSKIIYDDAVKKYNPKATIAMVSGGNDSATIYYLAEEFGINLDATLHINTRTGIRETTEFVRETFDGLIEVDAGTAYEDYVLRKGFFGVGIQAHAISYHILKAGPLRKAISHEFRKRRRNYPVFLLNGRRSDESANRKGRNLSVVDRDLSMPNNIWVSIIQHWTQENRDEYLKARRVECSPVAKAICRSGECMCGTMQSQAERIEAATIYPEWGKWLKDLEAEVNKKFPWKWGQQPDRSHFNGQQDLFQPMCTDCLK